MAGAGIAIRNNFPDLLQVADAFKAIFFDNFNLVGDQYSQLFNKETSDRQFEEFSYVTNLGTIPKATEGSALTFEAPVQGFDVRFTHDTFRKGYKVTREMLEDDQYSIFSRMPAAHGTSMMTTRNQFGANIYNNGFDSSVQTGADGLELFSTAHLLAIGGTQRNELTTAAPLSVDALEQALLDIRATTDDQGNILALRPRKLVIHPNNIRTAKEILGSVQDPESANNTINTFSSANTGLELIANDYLTSTTAWFIMCDVHPMLWLDRVLPSHEMDNEFDTDNAKFKVRARWSAGWKPQPWGIYGTPGV